MKKSKNINKDEDGEGSENGLPQTLSNDTKSAATHMRVGLPRALMYYKYGQLWECFFEQLGCKVVVSPPTDRAIYEAGEAASIDESCLASKVFLGHVDWLCARADAIFVPAFITREHRRGFCTKHQSLPDLVRNTFDLDEYISSGILNHVLEGVSKSAFAWESAHAAQLAKRAKVAPTVQFAQKDRHLHLPQKPFLITCEVGSDFKRKDLVESFVQIAHVVGVPAKRAAHAFKDARAAQKAADAQAAERARAALKSDAPIKVAIAAHPYVARDEYLCGSITRTLDGLGVAYVQACDMPEKSAIEASFKLSDTMPWATNRQLTGALLQMRPQIDGIILVSAFPCGPDSLANELIVRKLGDIPVLKVVLDGQSGDAGLVTRIESFIDILTFQMRGGYLHE